MIQQNNNGTLPDARPELEIGQHDPGQLNVAVDQIKILRDPNPPPHIVPESPEIHQDEGEHIMSLDTMQPQAQF